MDHDSDNSDNSDKKDKEKIDLIVPTPLIVLSDEEWKSYFSVKVKKEIKER